MKIILGISGASGFIYGESALNLLYEAGAEIHLVISKPAEKTMSLESSSSLKVLGKKAAKIYDINDLGASIASGSFKNIGMLIAPCSARTLSAIATGNSDNLLTRAADVALKERRKLVLMFRETPLHAVHIRNMLTVTEMGGIICPPVPSFYHKPENIAEIIRFNVARALDLFNIEIKIPRWE